MSDGTTMIEPVQPLPTGRALVARMRCLSDNILTLIHDPATGATATIDVPDAAAVSALAGSLGWRVSDILVTHRHDDHIQGVPALRAMTGARLVAPALAADALPGADLVVAGGETFRLGSLDVEVIATPGHCADHISFHIPDAVSVACGDTLFKLGCGRVFDSTPQTLWASLRLLMALPVETLVHCGHDYTLGNARFAAAVEPDSIAARERLAVAEADAAAGWLTGLTTIGWERQANPFLRVDEPAIAAAVGTPGDDPAETFAALRAWKNRF